MLVVLLIGLCWLFCWLVCVGWFVDGLLMVCVGCFVGWFVWVGLLMVCVGCFVGWFVLVGWKVLESVAVVERVVC